MLVLTTCVFAATIFALLAIKRRDETVSSYISPSCSLSTFLLHTTELACFITAIIMVSLSAFKIGWKMGL
jgi:hypothetical protein